MIIVPAKHFIRRNPPPAPVAAVDVGSHVDIAHDRKRLLAMTVLSALALILCLGWLVLSFTGQAVQTAHDGLPPVLHSLPLVRHEVHVPGLPAVGFYSLRESPWFSLELGLAALLALAALLRNIYRLQDADPVLTVSSKGLAFKPSLLGSRVSIPWSAIHDVRFRKLKRLCRVAVVVDRADRYAPQFGFALARLRLPGMAAPAQTVALTVSMGDAAWQRTQACIRGYLAAAGKPAAAAKSGSTNAPRSSAKEKNVRAPRTEATPLRGRTA